MAKLNWDSIGKKAREAALQKRQKELHQKAHDLLTEKEQGQAEIEIDDEQVKISGDEQIIKKIKPEEKTS